MAMASQGNQVANSHNRPANSTCSRSKMGFAGARFQATSPGGCKFCTQVQNLELAGPEVGDSASRNCFYRDDHASWPMIFFWGVRNDPFRVYADCQPGIHSRDSGKLRILTGCLALSLAAPIQRFAAGSLHQRWPSCRRTHRHNSAQLGRALRRR